MHVHAQKANGRAHRQLVRPYRQSGSVESLKAADHERDQSLGMTPDANNKNAATSFLAGMMMRIWQVRARSPPQLISCAYASAQGPPLMRVLPECAVSALGVCVHTFAHCSLILTFTRSHMRTRSLLTHGNVSVNTHAHYRRGLPLRLGPEAAQGSRGPRRRACCPARRQNEGMRSTFFALVYLGIHSTIYHSSFFFD